jgi:hypothetical protein
MKKGYIIAMAGMLTAGMVAQNALHVYKKDGSIVDYTVAELDSIVFEKPGTVIAETPTLTKSGTGASSQTVTEGNAITEFSYSWTNATNVTVTGLPTGVNATINTANSSVTTAAYPAAAFCQWDRGQNELHPAGRGSNIRACSWPQPGEPRKRQAPHRREHQRARARCGLFRRRG